MITFMFRSLAIGTLAILMFAGNALSQTASPILNTLEVQKRVASNTPGDNAALSAHFAALADRYTTAAKRHTTMAQSFVGNPNRNTGSGMSAHCRRLAELNTESAATLRELAGHHKALAAGATSTAPAAGGRFQGGVGASEPTEAELKALAAKAAAHFDRLLANARESAKEATAAADMHAQLANVAR